MVKSDGGRGVYFSARFWLLLCSFLHRCRASASWCLGSSALFLPASMPCFQFLVPWVICSLRWPAAKMFYTKIAQSSLFMARWKESKGGFPMSQTWLRFFFAGKTTGISLALQSVVRKKTWCNYARCHFSPAFFFSPPQAKMLQITLSYCTQSAVS